MAVLQILKHEANQSGLLSTFISSGKAVRVAVIHKVNTGRPSPPFITIIAWPHCRTQLSALHLNEAFRRLSILMTVHGLISPLKTAWPEFPCQVIHCKNLGRLVLKKKNRYQTDVELKVSPQSLARSFHLVNQKWLSASGWRLHHLFHDKPSSPLFLLCGTACRKWSAVLSQLCLPTLLCPQSLFSLARRFV